MYKNMHYEIILFHPDLKKPRLIIGASYYAIKLLNVLYPAIPSTVSP